MSKHAKPTYTRRRLTVASVVAGIALLTGSGAAFATPSAPTNGGNGAGQSGQCTGPAGERPTSCQSPGGVSDK
jgi:hypothetical protein